MICFINFLKNKNENETCNNKLNSMYLSLNEVQTNVFNEIIFREKKLFFLDGFGSYGKTYVSFCAKINLSEKLFLNNILSNNILYKCLFLSKNFGLLWFNLTTK